MVADRQTDLRTLQPIELLLQLKMLYKDIFSRTIIQYTHLMNYQVSSDDTYPIKNYESLLIDSIIDGADKVRKM